MKAKVILSFLTLTLFIDVYGQNLVIDLSFTAVNNVDYVQLDSIKVINRTQGSDTTIYWPDTTLWLYVNPGDLMLYVGYSSGFPVGVRERKQDTKDFYLSQSSPNPIEDQGLISLYIPENGDVTITVTDLQGRVELSSEWKVNKGNYLFRFTPGDGPLFLFTARWNERSRTIKILSTGSVDGKKCALDYIGNGNREYSMKEESVVKTDLVMLESGILDSFVYSTHKPYTFQFATNIPCPWMPTVVYEGQVYNTIQIFSQCWLKENLNVGTMIDGSQDQANNGIVEKYCYNNEPDSCTKYGGLYQWDEMMQYTTQQGVQGICPPGWQIPTDEEWKVLEGAVDSQFGIGDSEWDKWASFRGYDVGTNIKTTSGWSEGGNGNDLFGFSGLPGGQRSIFGYFVTIGGFGHWWMATESDFRHAWYRELLQNGPDEERFHTVKVVGFSVRCLKDY